MKKQC